MHAVYINHAAVYLEYGTAWLWKETQGQTVKNSCVYFPLCQGRWEDSLTWRSASCELGCCLSTSLILPSNYVNGDQLVQIRHIVWGSLCLLMYILKSQGSPFLRLEIICVCVCVCVYMNIILRLYYFSTLICISENKYYLCFTLFKLCLFETVAHSPNWSRNPYVNQPDFEFAVFLSLPPNYWNFRHTQNLFFLCWTKDILHTRQVCYPWTISL